MSNSADPQKWSHRQVEQWLEWATQEFGLNLVDVSKFRVNGMQLCTFTKDDFLQRAPPYTGDILYLHLTLLITRRGVCGVCVCVCVCVHVYEYARTSIVVICISVHLCGVRTVTCCTYVA